MINKCINDNLITLFNYAIKIEFFDSVRFGNTKIDKTILRIFGH